MRKYFPTGICCTIMADTGFPAALTHRHEMFSTEMLLSKACQCYLIIPLTGKLDESKRKKKKAKFLNELAILG